MRITNRLKPYLQLVRLPNVFTAAADSLAGWMLVRGNLEQPGRWLPLVLASMSIYAAGIALNDWFDYAIDLQERPNRPLPSGRISRRFAGSLGMALLVLGPVLAALSGSIASAATAIMLAACVLGYDAGLKRTWLGPEVMGACRGLNLLLGMSQAPSFGGPIAWLVAGSMVVYVAGITWISRSETHSGARRVWPRAWGWRSWQSWACSPPRSSHVVSHIPGPRPRSWPPKDYSCFCSWRWWSVWPADRRCASRCRIGFKRR